MTTVIMAVLVVNGVRGTLDAGLNWVLFGPGTPFGLWIGVAATHLVIGLGLLVVCVRPGGRRWLDGRGRWLGWTVGGGMVLLFVGQGVYRWIMYR
ncbi:MAG: hypothetical protein AB8G96_12205 [Phycisphaerales bacterium]